MQKPCVHVKTWSVKGMTEAEPLHLQDVQQIGGIWSRDGGSSASSAASPSQQPGNGVEKGCILGAKRCPYSLLRLMKKTQICHVLDVMVQNQSQPVLKSVHEVP